MAPRSLLMACTRSSARVISLSSCLATCVGFFIGAQVDGAQTLAVLAQAQQLAFDLFGIRQSSRRRRRLAPTPRPARSSGFRRCGARSSWRCVRPQDGRPDGHDPRALWTAVPVPRASPCRPARTSFSAVCRASAAALRSRSASDSMFISLRRRVGQLLRHARKARRGRRGFPRARVVSCSICSLARVGARAPLSRFPARSP